MLAEHCLGGFLARQGHRVLRKLNKPFLHLRRDQLADQRDPEQKDKK